MKNLCFLIAASFSLSACSLMERSVEEPASPTSAAEHGEGEVSLQKTDYLEKELSRLNAKVEALDTKVEVLTTNFEKQQLHGTQPTVSNEPIPQAPTNAALGEPVHATVIGSTAGAASLNSAEAEFRTAMELFQSGKNLEAGVAFSGFAQRNSAHHLAPHALYWAGEANARAEQWRLAVANWEELQRKYPQSAYMPEALAGLVRAYGALGNSQQATDSKAVLLASFPQAPAALSLQSINSTPASPTQAERISDDVPAEERSALHKDKESIEAPFKEQPIESSDDSSGSDQEDTE